MGYNSCVGVLLCCSGDFYWNNLTFLSEFLFFCCCFFMLDLGPYERWNKQLLSRLQITIRVKKNRYFSTRENMPCATYKQPSKSTDWTKILAQLDRARRATCSSGADLCVSLCVEVLFVWKTKGDENQRTERARGGWTERRLYECTNCCF